MVAQGVERKLTAILTADVVGYSRLMGEDHEATVNTLTTYRDVFSSYIQYHRGRVVNAPGDSILAEFASAVDALTCAVEIQRELAERNHELPEPRRMEFRIGLNLGDVLVKEGQLYGDGVNIAARMESLAAPGGICISGTVFDQIESRVPLEYISLGEQAVKNIAKPVRVYQVRPRPGAAAEPIERVKAKAARSWRTAALGSAALLTLVSGIIGAWYLFTHPLAPPTAVKSGQPLPLPDKPSIAVLPFVNMSGAPDNSYFSDGMAEEITATLSKLSDLFVIDRNAAFTYRSKDVGPEDVGEELGVRYVLTGSAQNTDGRVAINVQLVEVATGRPVWSEEFDRPLQELFEVQQKITRRIVAELDVGMIEGDEERVWRQPTDNLEAYDSYLIGLALNRRLTAKANEKAETAFERAIELDTNFASAHAALGSVHISSIQEGWSRFYFDPMQRAVESANRAIALDKSQPVAYAVLGFVHDFKQQPELAIHVLEKAVALHPNNSRSNALLANALLHLGRLEEALLHIKSAIRRSPVYPPWYSLILGDIYRRMGRYEEAILVSKKTLRGNPKDFNAHIQLIAAYVRAGQMDEARVRALEFIRLYPNFSLDAYVNLEGRPMSLIYINLQELERVVDDLRKAGLK